MHNEGMIVKTTNGVAVAGLFMPAWLPTLGQASDVAGMLVPILSAAWLMVQIASHFRRKRDDDDAE